MLMNRELKPGAEANRHAQKVMTELERANRNLEMQRAGISPKKPHQTGSTPPVMNSSTSSPPTDAKLAAARALASAKWRDLTDAERGRWLTRDFFIDSEARRLVNDQNLNDSLLALAQAEWREMSVMDRSQHISGESYVRQRHAQLKKWSDDAMAAVVAQSEASRTPPPTTPTTAIAAAPDDEPSRPLDESQAKMKATAEWAALPLDERMKWRAESTFVANRAAELRGLIRTSAPSPNVASMSYEQWRQDNPGPVKLTRPAALERARLEWVSMNAVERRKHDGIGAYVVRRADELVAESAKGAK